MVNHPHQATYNLPSKTCQSLSSRREDIYSHKVDTKYPNKLPLCPLCQPKMGDSDPPSPLVSQKSEIGLPPPPPLVRKKNQKLSNPPLPLSKMIFCHTLMNLVKPTFEKDISNSEIN